MKPQTPLDKRTRKQQQAHHSALRGSWDGVCPVTRVIPDKRRYDRKRDRRLIGRIAALEG